MTKGVVKEGARTSAVGSSSFGIAVNIVLQGLSTLLSRMSGLTRDVLTAYFLGAGSTSDAFFASFRIPNSIRKLIGEGPLSASFVPVFIQQSIRNKTTARRFAGATMVVIGLISFSLATILFVCMPSFVGFIAPGLKLRPETFHLAVKLSRISIPFMGLTCIVAVLGGVTNANQSFFAFGITPLILNFSMIACMLLLGPLFPSMAFGLSVGVVLGGVIQLVFMLYSCRKIGMFPLFSLGKDPELFLSLRSLFIKLVPIIFGQGIFQVNMFVDGIFASLTVKTQSYLYYSDRLSQFVITIVGHTLGMVSLPMIARHVKQGQKSFALDVQNKCLSWAMIWSIPAAFSLFFLAHGITEVIYCRGNFGLEDVYHVGNMLKITCLVIPILAMNKVYYSSVYSIDKVAIAVISGFVAVVVNLCINFLLMHRVLHYYVAISSAFSAVVEFLILFFALKFRYNFLRISKKDVRALCVVIPSGAFVGWLSSALFNYVSLPIFIKLAFIVPLGVVVYSVIISVFGIMDIIGTIRGRFLRRGNAGA